MPKTKTVSVSVTVILEVEVPKRSKDKTIGSKVTEAVEHHVQWGLDRGGMFDNLPAAWEASLWDTSLESVTPIEDEENTRS